jgi:isoleucyl-tRNA synthetase
MAPFTPFLAEELYQKLTGGESVHLLDWPEAGHLDELLLEEMTALRELITEGLAQRASAGIKVRQPLRMAEIRHRQAERLDRFADILKEELNVKMVLFNQQTRFEGDDKTKFIMEINTELDDDLKREGLVREIIRHVQQVRKQAGLEVDDRINLGLETDSQALRAVLEDQQLANLIKQETLTQELNHSPINGTRVNVKIDNSSLVICLVKS